MKNVISVFVSLLLISFLFWQCESEPVASDTTGTKPIVEKEIKKEKEATLAEVKTIKQDELLEMKVPEVKEEEKVKVKKEKEPFQKETEKKIAKKKTVPKQKKITTPKSKGKPKISFTETSYEFGLINQGEEIKHQFKFKNTGKKDLLITNVTATCGCTQPSYPFVPIAPGETGFIGVVYNSTGKLGAQKPTLTVITNASPKTYKLFLNGVVDAERAPEQPKDSIKN